MFGFELVGGHLGVELGETRFGQNVDFISLLVLDFDIVHLGVDAKGEIGGKSPGLFVGVWVGLVFHSFVV